VTGLFVDRGDDIPRLESSFFAGLSLTTSLITSREIFRQPERLGSLGGHGIGEQTEITAATTNRFHETTHDRGGEIDGDGETDADIAARG